MNGFADRVQRYIPSRYLEVIHLTKPTSLLRNACHFFGNFSGTQNRYLFQKAVFSPQNHATVQHLHLPFEPRYVRDLGDAGPEIEEDLSEHFTDIYEDFVEDATRMVIRRLLEYMSEAPELMRQLVKSLLSYAVTTGCTTSDDIITVTRDCLNVLRRQNYPDSRLVIEVLLTLCSSSQRYVEDLASGNYPLLTFRYVLESCANAGFNLRSFLVNRPERKQSYLMPVCPVQQNVIQGDCILLRLLLEFGFERYEPHMNDTNWSYQKWKIRRILGYQRLTITLERYNNYNEYLNRYYLLMETIYLICASFIGTPEQWVQCARLLYKSIPDPFLSEGELNNLLYGNCSVLYRDKITIRCHAFFSDILVAILAPRSLKHLSRCAVRKALADNFQLPSGIEKLELPREVIEYLTDLT